MNNCTVYSIGCSDRSDGQTDRQVPGTGVIWIVGSFLGR